MRLVLDIYSVLFDSFTYPLNYDIQEFKNQITITNYCVNDDNLNLVMSPSCRLILPTNTTLTLTVCWNYDTFPINYGFW